MVAIGTDTLTALTRHFILPQLTDNAYTKNNALLYRLYKGNKRVQKGGLHIEIPVVWPNGTAAGGTFSGYDVLTTAPIDNVRNAFVDWKQYYTSFSIDESTLLRADSNLAVANLVQHNGRIATMDLAGRLGAGVWSNGVSDPKGMDGFKAVVSSSNQYGGIDRSTNTWWRGQIDSAASALSYARMYTLKSSCSIGGTSPTIWFGNGTNYNRLYALGFTTSGYSTTFNREPGGHDEILMQAGFTNFLHENIPFVRDDHLGDSDLFCLNEDFIELVVSPRGDFHVEPFQKPWNQLVYVSTIHWAGNIICTSPRSQGAMTALTA